MRIGERLIREDLITVDQLNQALSTQVVRGGRIGTNLVELGHIDIDTLAECLGRHHGMPVATEKHFELASPEVQRALSEEIVARWGAVPLGPVLGGSDQLVVAVMHPLPAQALDEIASALGHPLITAVAPELRILYQLEQVYGIPRSNRFVRPPPEDVLPVIADPTDDEAMVDIQIHLAVEASDEEMEEFEIDVDSSAEFPSLGELSSPPEGSSPGVKAPPLPPPLPPVDLDGPDPGGAASAPGVPPNRTLQEDGASDGASDGSNDRPERRKFVKTLSEMEPDDAQAQLARIPIKKVAPAGRSGVAPPPAPAQVPTTLEGTFRAIRQATGRDRVGDLVVCALRDFFEVFDAGAILVVRAPIAIGWKGFVRGNTETSIESVALPLNEPSVVRDAYVQREGIIRAADDGGSELERRLWSLLQSEYTPTMAVYPVLMGAQVVCLLYAQSPSSPDEVRAEAGDSMSQLAACTTKAFMRLIRAAQR